MNDARRKELERAIVLIRDAAAIIENGASEEQDYFDGMPENLQGSEKGERAQEVAEELETVSGELEEFQDRIEELTA